MPKKALTSCIPVHFVTFDGVKISFGDSFKLDILFFGQFVILPFLANEKDLHTYLRAF